MINHDALDLAKCPRGHAGLVRDCHRGQPELGLAAEWAVDVHMRTLAAVSRKEVEAVGAEAKDRGHPID